MRARTWVAASAASITALVLATVPVTAASSAPAAAPEDPIASGLAGPLQFDVSSNGSIYVAQGFAGSITKIRPNGTMTNLVEGEAVGGVATDGYEVVYTVGDSDGPSEELLKRRFANGTVRTLADLGAYEAAHNPDQRNRYGFRQLSDECAAELTATVPPDVLASLLPYTGRVDSHPYAVAYAPGGGWYVADAGANAIFLVTADKQIELVNVPRPRKVGISQEAADALGLPDCVVGLTLALEPVPTDVEVNNNGFIIASLLPGGPEDASLGARGAVLRVSPGDFEWTVMGTGFLGATNIATAPGGRVYVAELFGNKVSLLRNHQVTTVADVVGPAGVEFRDGTLYASIDAFANGQIVTLP